MPARDEGGEGRVLLDILHDARGPGVGGEGEHLADPVLVPESEVDADDAAVAPSDDVRLRDLERVHQRNDVVRHQIVSVRPCVARRAAVAAAVHQDHGVARRDRGNLIAPVVAVGETAVQENDGRALAIDRVVDPDPVGVRHAAAVGCDRRRRRRQGSPPLERADGQGDQSEEGGEGKTAHRGEAAAIP